MPASQSANPTMDTADGGSGLLEILLQPVVLEIVLISIVLAVIGWIAISMRRALARLSGRKMLVQYLTGVEAGMAGDAQAAAKALGAVVRADADNVGARLALGDALYKLRRPTEAHKQHVEAREVFEVGGAGVQLSVVRDLRAAGQHADAIERLDEALEQHPKDAQLLEEAWSLKTEAGLFQQALVAGRALLQQESETDGVDMRRRLAVTAARAGMLCLSHGDRDRAAQLFQESLGHDPDNPEAQFGRLLAAPELDVAALPAPALAPAVAQVAGAEDQVAAEVAVAAPTLLDFFPESVCRQCGSPRSSASSPCAICRDVAPPIYAEDGFRTEIDDPLGSLDEIEENEAWYQKLAARIGEGDPQAIERLGAGGAEAIRPTLLAMLDGADQDGRLTEVCIGLGQRYPRELVAARAALHRREEPSADSAVAGTQDLDSLLAPVFRRLGPAAHEAFQDLMVESAALADQGLRALVVEYFVGLGQLGPFEDLSARYAPVEIVRQLNKTPPRELVPLLSKVPKEASFLRDALLLDPAFDQPEALVLAAVSVDDDVLKRFVKIFEQRGSDRTVTSFLVRQLGKSRAGQRAEQLLAELRGDTLRHLIAGFADPDLGADAHEALARLIRGFATPAIAELLRCFSSGPSELDARTIALLASFADDAVTPIAKVYRQVSRSPGKGSTTVVRGRHPLACMARVLGSIASNAARKALQKIADQEKDVELEALARSLLRKIEPGGQA